MPKPIEWNTIKCQGNIPTPRIGHTFIKIDRTFLLFGGLETMSSDKIGASNTVYTMRLALNNCQWSLNNCSGDLPLPRCNHSAVEIKDNQMMIFGGYFSSKQRFNDTYILRLNGSPSYFWYQPSNQKSGQEPQNTESKIGAPEPRANHTATFVPELNRVYIFGGHGGVGYSRKAFNDMHFIDCDTFEWTRVETKGSAPEPRGGHIAGRLPKTSKIFVQGGWSSISQYSNIFVFDFDDNAWTELNINFDTPRWNHCGLVIPALPHWKLFLFGGSSAYFEEGTPRNFGSQVNSTVYVDLIEDLNTAKLRAVDLEADEGLACPSGRENASMIYDSKEKRLLVFGGWSNTFNNDIFQLNIGKITGPDYAIYAIRPSLGPLTGNTRCSIIGEGFRRSGNFFIRFQSGKFFRDVTATLESDTVIRCQSPNFEEVGPKEVEVRVYFESEDLTITRSAFKYFLNTRAEKTIAFGPGLLKSNAVGQKTSVYIQSRNVNNENRKSGNDQFKVKIYHHDSSLEQVPEESEEDPKAADKEAEPEAVEREMIPFELKDSNDGQYTIDFQVEREGEVVVEIEVLNEKHEFEPIRGSPFMMSATAEAEETSNDLKGPLVKKYLAGRIKHIEKMIEITKKYIDPANGEYETNVFDLLRIVETIQKFNEKKEAITLELEVMAQIMENLEREGVDNRKDQELTRRLLKGVQFLQKESRDVERRIQPNIKVEKKACSKKIDAFEDNLKYYILEMRKSPVYRYSTGEVAAFDIFERVETEIEGFQKRLKDFEYFSRMFKFPEKTSQSKKNLDLIQQETSVVGSLWRHIKQTKELFEDYLERRWADVDAGQMQEEVKALSKRLTSMTGIDKKSDVFRGIMKEIKNWAQFLPIVEELRKDSMNVEDDRHWKQFKEVLETDLVLGAETTLRVFWDFGIYGAKVREEIEYITEQAAQENKIETDLKKIEELWRTVYFEFIPLELKDQRLEMLKMPDEFLEVLDDHQMMVQTIAGNKHMSYYETEVNKWLRGLSSINECVRLLSEVQKTWSFLINLFIYSQEVKKELPSETEHFKKIHSVVQQLLAEGKRTSNIFEFSNMDFNERDVIAALESILVDLAQCQKGLNDFIASKRKVFPRFYFLTMEELLDVLANGNNPELLFQEKNYMNKVVQAANKLIFADSSADERPFIRKMTSNVGTETLEFCRQIQLVGKVENYLGDVLDLIRETLNRKVPDVLEGYCKDFEGEQRKRFIDENYSQLNILTNNIRWVSEVEQRFLDLQNGDSEAIKVYYQSSHERLTEMIKFVQSPLDSPNGDKALRTKLMVLITVDTHNRDIVDVLIKDNVRKAEEMQWQSQLKFYWDTDKNDCFIKVADALMWYKYEYLGNGSRLVITPLTDRIYVTATQALHLKMGCAPAGPAGTGKTETTKDLAGAVGKACYVFNCSTEMNYQTMGNTFKGLASSGCWGCFDEFNRLIPAVLSVCTVQFKAITDAIKMGKQKFTMDKETLNLDPTCGVFITMNPGYLGRSTLPEGLKALFRYITVMVPDLDLICENSLMAEGFVEARSLALKFVTLYRLCKSLFSDQKHYDFGLRAIKSVLRVAGSFKRNEPDISEQKLLFRALRDFNYPKIAACDLGIFDALLGDLFPGINIPRKINETFEDTIKAAALEEGLTPHSEFILKVVQLKEVLEIRHCVFLMGPPGAGKSSTWKILAKANEKMGHKTMIVDIDPKVVDTSDFYGYSNITTKEWKNGLFSYHMQLLSEEMADDNPKWIVLDGDLDANWIESMNSVMDDNRMLTLANNGRINLKDCMRLLFEIRDLEFSTPATVSRAGILYISDDKGYQRECYITSWVRRFSAEMNVEPDLLEKLFAKYIAKIVDFMRKSCKFIIPISYIGMTVSCCKLLESNTKARFNELLLPTEKGQTVLKLDPLKFEYVFAFCAIWGFGGCLCEKDKQDFRKDFSSFWKNQFKGHLKIPSKGTIFDYYVKFEEGRVFFEEWKKQVQPIDYDPSVNMQSVTVSIPETVSVQTVSKHLISVRHPILYIGSSGTGKTQLVKGLLQDIFRQSGGLTYSFTINFNYYTDSKYLQSMLESELVKQGNRYGPKKGSNFKLIYFIDDLNMPQDDGFNTQTAIALLRQHMDYSHWYDISKTVPFLKEIANTQTVAAMNPTSGSFHVNPRYQRHFWMVNINYPEPNSQILIYETFLKGHFRKFKGHIQEMALPIIKAAIFLHEKVQSTFRKTSKNFHYEFTIRHLAGIFQGILQSNSAHHWDQEKMVKLWIHESERMYCDRLVSNEHIHRYRQIAFESVKKSFSKFNLQKYFSGQAPEGLIFTNFPTGYQNERYYDLLTKDDAEEFIKEALRDYNEYAEMKLVLFDDAIRHVCKITRILSNPSGHALLVGVGGSGKQSLTKLSAFMCDLNIFSITVSSSYGMSNLKEDIMDLYKKTGLKDEGICFLVNDSHITNERFLVYINDILSSGEVADLYNEDDRINIINSIRPKAKAEGKPTNTVDEVWSFFIDKVKQNLHVTLCFSPIADTFRTRARQFPGVVNCTVIDWFQPWPKEALRSVAEQFLKEVDLGGESIRKIVIDYMPYSFETVNRAAVKCYEIEKRHVHSTPKSFLELLNLFINMLTKKRESLEKDQTTYEFGLNKLEETEKIVADLQKKIEVIQVEVDRNKKTADEVAERVGREKAKVEEQSENAKREEDECTRIKQVVEETREFCELEVQKLQPMVNDAKQQLKGLNVQDFTFMKSLPTPPQNVDEVFFCIMYMFAGVKGFDFDIETDKNGLPKNLNWKNGCLKLMKEPYKLIERLNKFPVEINQGRVPDKNFMKIKPFFKQKHFQDPTIMSNKSKAAGNILVFISFMVKYYDAMVLMIPRREALKTANEDLVKANKKLAKVKEEVAKLEADLAVLVEEFNQATEAKNKAIAEAAHYAQKLSLAQRLVNALVSEKGRWKESIVAIQDRLNLIVGDVLLAASFISYTGPFTKNFREYIINDELLAYLNKKGIPKSQGVDPVSLLVDDATKAKWNNQGLPSDSVSIENGAILSTSERYPLMIDPQLQGITWIKEKEKDNGLISMRVGSKNYIKILERAIEEGMPVLLENLDEQLDPMLTPVISRSTFKKAGKKFLKFGGKNLLFNESFKLFMQTKLSNPHYPPEIQAESALINFTVTEEGLSDQLLTLVVSKERPDLSQQKIELIQSQNQFKIELKELENGLLEKLKNLEGDVVQNIDLINNLEQSQKLSREIRDKVAIALETEQKINKASEFFRPVAVRGSLIFFTMKELHNMSAFYMYSLESYLDVIVRALRIVADREARAKQEREEREREQAKTDKSKSGSYDLDHSDEESEKAPEAPKPDPSEDEEYLRKHVGDLTEEMTLCSFKYVQRGLFEKHKIIFATMLCLRIMEKTGSLNQEEIKHLIQGKVHKNSQPAPEKVRKYLTEQIWRDCKELEYIEDFGNLSEKLETDHLHWRKWYAEEKIEEIDLPKQFKNVSDFHKLLLIKAMRPDRVSSALKKFVSSNMSPEFINQDIFDLEQVLSETPRNTPVFFVLFPGIDPIADIEACGLRRGKQASEGTFINISMGQGQETRALKLLEESAEKGHWIFLQNVHLMTNWLKTFERKLEEVTLNPHEEFRCFISSEPPNKNNPKPIPEAIMQKCLKISNQAPQDLKANMLRAINHFSQKNIDDSSKKSEYKCILFALCYFHSIVLGRKKFGTQGWSGSYNFNDGDLTICADVLHNYLEKYDQVPYDDLRYIYGDIMYGGHITDRWDRRTNRTYLKVLIRPQLLQSMNLVPGNNPIYRVPDPNKNEFRDYVNYIDKIPNESPLMFGMHSNAEINYLTTQCETIFRTIVDIEGGGAGPKDNKKDSIQDLVRKLKDLLPPQFDLLKLQEFAEERWDDVPNPYDIVCLQECERMNTLLTEIAVSLKELKMGLDGSLNMTENMEMLATSLKLDRVPTKWGSFYSSKRPLSSWFENLEERCAQLVEWSSEMILPKSICLSHLFNPMSFLTAVMQLTARQKGFPLDSMVLDTEVTHYRDHTEILSEPDQGVYIHGLFLEGASWELAENDGYLVEQKQKELHPRLPVIRVVALTKEELNMTDKYKCPVYYTTQRGETYVFTAHLKMDSDESQESKWILRGVAAILNEDF